MTDNRKIKATAGIAAENSAASEMPAVKSPSLGQLVSRDAADGK